MIERARELAIKLASFNDVSYEHVSNSKRYKLTSNKGVKWSTRSSKLGNIHYSKDHLYLALDFPIGEITESLITEKMNLPRKNKGEKKSGFYIKKAEETDKFDSLRIKLYQDELTKIDSNNLMALVKEVFTKSIG